jgi:transposase
MTTKRESYAAIWFKARHAEVLAAIAAGDPARAFYAAAALATWARLYGNGGAA